jgi:hypothetical protein
MNLETARELYADAAEAILFAEDPGVPIDAWTLDELDGLADLGSVRAAWAGTDDRSV